MFFARHTPANLSQLRLMLDIWVGLCLTENITERCYMTKIVNDFMAYVDNIDNVYTLCTEEEQ